MVVYKSTRKERIREKLQALLAANQAEQQANEAVWRRQCESNQFDDLIYPGDLDYADELLYVEARADFAYAQEQLRTHYSQLVFRYSLVSDPHCEQCGDTGNLRFVYKRGLLCPWCRCTYGPVTVSTPAIRALFAQYRAIGERLHVQEEEPYRTYGFDYLYVAKLLRQSCFELPYLIGELRRTLNRPTIYPYSVERNRALRSIADTIERVTSQPCVGCVDGWCPGCAPF